MCETERQAKMELIEFDRFAEQDDCDKYNMLQQSACEIRFLENKNQQLEERINKAIEYIEDVAIVDYEIETSHDLYDTQIFKVIRILRGESDE